MKTTDQEVRLKSLLIKEYGLSPLLEVKKIKTGLSNENYLIIDSHIKYVARVAHFAVENQTTNMVDMMLFAESVISTLVPKLIKTLTGQPYTHIDSSPLFLISFIEGENGKLNTISTEKIASFGKAVASFHLLSWRPILDSRTLDPLNIFEIYNNFFPKLKEIEFSEKDYYLSFMEDEVKFFLDNKITLINILPKGIIHNDLIPENIMFNNNEVEAFIDLEEIGHGIMLLDLGRVLSYWFFDPVLHRYNTKDAAIFLDSYQTIRKLSDEEKNSLELVTRFVAFRHSVYVGKLLYQKKLQTIRDIPDFQSLEYFVKHTLNLSTT